MVEKYGIFYFFFPFFQIVAIKFLYNFIIS